MRASLPSDTRAAAEEADDTLRAELGVALALSNNGQRRDPILKTDTKPVPPGGLTSSTLGQSDRMQRALARPRGITASTMDDTEGEVMA
jgi:hypothetical protein